MTEHGQLLHQGQLRPREAAQNDGRTRPRPCIVSAFGLSEQTNLVAPLIQSPCFSYIFIS